MNTQREQQLNELQRLLSLTNMYQSEQSGILNAYQEHNNLDVALFNESLCLFYHIR
jgi:hypothetical protein